MSDSSASRSAETTLSECAPERPGDGVQVERLLYVAQLGQGVGSLRFAPSIEAEFRDDYHARSLARLRVGFGLAVGLYLLFLTIRLLTESGPAAQ